jgi:hypothetical protein
MIFNHVKRFARSKLRKAVRKKAMRRERIAVGTIRYIPPVQKTPLPEPQA